MEQGDARSILHATQSSNEIAVKKPDYAPSDKKHMKNLVTMRSHWPLQEKQSIVANAAQYNCCAAEKQVMKYYDNMPTSISRCVTSAFPSPHKIFASERLDDVVQAYAIARSANSTQYTADCIIVILIHFCRAMGTCDNSCRKARASVRRTLSTVGLNTHDLRKSYRKLH